MRLLCTTVPPDVPSGLLMTMPSPALPEIVLRPLPAVPPIVVPLPTAMIPAS